MTIIEGLGELGQKQRVRLALEDGTTVEARVNQSVYTPGENLRLELATDGPDEYERYQVRARVEDGTWTPARARGYAQNGETWVDFGTVTDVTPLDMYQTTKSGDMEAQEETGTDE